MVVNRGWLAVAAAARGRRVVLVLMFRSPLTRLIFNNLILSTGVPLLFVPGCVLNNIVVVVEWLTRKQSKGKRCIRSPEKVKTFPFVTELTKTDSRRFFR